ncbi:MAG: hypothetical protein ACR2PT_15270, partial [Endozoicomonas sp.]
MANVGKTPDQGQISYHLRMALALTLQKAKAFLRKVSVAFLPAGIRANLERSRQPEQSVFDRSVASTPSTAGVFVHTDVERVKDKLKECVRTFRNQLSADNSLHPNYKDRLQDAIDLGDKVLDGINHCDSLDALVQLLDLEAPGVARKGLFTALDEIISEKGLDLTLSEESREIITEATEKDGPVTGQITGTDSDIPWAVRSDKEKALEALKSSFLDYLVQM